MPSHDLEVASIVAPENQVTSARKGFEAGKGPVSAFWQNRHQPHFIVEEPSRIAPPPDFSGINGRMNQGSAPAPRLAELLREASCLQETEGQFAYRNEDNLILKELWDYSHQNFQLIENFDGSGSRSFL